MTDNRKPRYSRSGTNRRYSVKKQKRRTTIFLILGILIVVLVVGGIWAYFRFRTYDSYKVLSTLDITNSDERTFYHEFEKGYLNCASDGLVYFDRKGIIWAETYEMTQPLIDICGAYAAVADLKSTDIYLYDESGLVNRFSAAHPILAVEVSQQGVVAVSTNDGSHNYIEVSDKEGKELIQAKSSFATSGYLMDIALSENGSYLAAAFLSVSAGTLESKVVFYDFNGEGEIAGGFNQYKNIVITTVEFLGPSTVCAVGDGAFTFYRTGAAPSIIYENLAPEWEIRSIFFDKNRLGMIVEDETSGTGYVAKVFNSNGKETASVGFDFPYSRAGFAGNNILLYSANNCEIYSFYGVKRFSYAFDEKIEYMLSCGSGRDYIYATANRTEFIKIT